MIATAVLAGILALLYLPYLGKLLCHLLLHPLIHFLDHGGWRMGVFNAAFCGVLFAIPACVLLGYPWGAVQAVLVLVIVVSIVTAH